MLAAPPVVTYTIDGIEGANNWYRGSSGGNYVVVHWTVTGSITSTTGCEYAIQIPGPNKGTTRTCSATGPGGQTIITTRVIKIDATAPAVHAAADRAPDSNGWFNHAVRVAFGGSDATSGVASCSTSTYAGPDNAKAIVPGTCTDRAGNVGRASFPLAYDATPPQLKKLRLKNAKRAVVLRWQTSSDTQRVEVARAPGERRGSTALVYNGSAKAFRDKGLQVGVKYRYTISAFDAAANKVSRTIGITATGALLAPVPGARVTGHPRLVWTPARGASYYNVQLVRGGRIFSAWPTRTSMRLPRSWTYHGHRYHLHAGVYRWYVWPGFGKLAASRYGQLVGRSSFLFAGR